MIQLILICMTLMLSGCMVGPSYDPPVIETPETFRYELKDATGSLDVKWWTQFEDSVLEALIDEGLANNKDIKIAAANIMNAAGILIQIRAPLFPQFGYTGAYNRQRVSETLATTQMSSFLPLSFPNPQTTLQAVINGSWEIDLWGRIRRQVQAAGANLYATYEARQNVIISVVASIADTYIQLRGLDAQLVIAIDTMNSYYEAVKYFELQLKYGQESEMAVAQAKTQYETARAKVPQLKSQIAQVENSLSVLLGRNPGSIERGKSIRELKIPQVPADLPSELLRQRPDIIEAEQRLIAANAQIGAAKALYYPSLSLTGFYGNASQQLSNLFTGPSHVWSFTGTVTGPIFTAGAIYGQVVQAEAQEEAALVNYQLTIQEAFADVESALVARTMLVEQLDAQVELVKAAGEYQRLAMLQYKGGYAPYFMVIQAQEQYFPAELAWAQAQAQLISSLVNIYQAMGGGWVTIADSLTEPPEPELELCENPE